MIRVNAQRLPWLFHPCIQKLMSLYNKESAKKTNNKKMKKMIKKILIQRL